MEHERLDEALVRPAAQWQTGAGDSQQQPSFAESLRERFALPASQKIRSYSQGQQAKAGLIVALAFRPDLLLLDEPSSGLDPVVRRDILEAIIRTVAEERRTVFFSSHLLDEIERVCDHIAMIRAGRVALFGRLDDVKQSHRRLLLRFDQPQPTPPDLAHALTLQGGGREWTGLCHGDRPKLMRTLQSAGAHVVAEESPSLDEIFVAQAALPRTAIR